MVTLCKKLTNNEKRDKVLIGFGDWSKKDGSPIKGRYGPVKKFRAELCRWAHVLDVDEYHTSKRCSECKNTQTVNVPIDADLRRKQNGVWITKTVCHEIVRCQNNACSKKWQRDINSAINHYNITYNWIHNLDRPLYLQRPKQKP